METGEFGGAMGYIIGTIDTTAWCGGVESAALSPWGARVTCVGMTLCKRGSLAKDGLTTHG
jgi:hypothetical protein